MGRLEDKVAIVTGGARGLGRVFCLAMIKEGAKIVVVDILGNEAQQTAEEIRTGAVLLLGSRWMFPLKKRPSGWLRRL